VNNFDVIIPCHPKDEIILTRVIKSLDCLSNKRSVYIISPSKIDLKISNDKYTLIYDKDFDHLFTIDQIKTAWNNKFPHFAYRASWIYQQLLKLHAHKIIKNLSESYLALDADTIVLNDLHIDTNKFQYCIAKENHAPYKKTYWNLTKKQPVDFSFIYHHMVFNQSILNEFLEYVELLHAKPFCEALLDSMSYDNQSPFSEWDSYGNWIYSNHSEICEHRQLRSSDLHFIPDDNQINELSNYFDLISSHGWLRGIEAS